MANLQSSYQLIQNFEDCLTEKGLTFEVCFESILGIKNVADAAITKEELILCFDLMGFEYKESGADLSTFMISMC